jgi:asparagine synthase (glutamine-hydrolysing)
MSSAPSWFGTVAEEQETVSVQGGIWNVDGEPVKREALAAISHRAAEYGPDGEAFHLDGNVGLFYRPFHTTPGSSRETQPYVSVSGRVIIWDGRLDNRQELIAQLGRLGNAEESDVSLISAAFEQWGTGTLPRLVGDWALSIWDPSDRSVTLARDHIGVRPLFYYSKPGRLMWCSHLSPLALCGDRFTPCDRYFAGYILLWPDADSTPYNEIHSVPPANFVRVSSGTIRKHPYWIFQPQRKTRYKRDAEYEEHFRFVFRQAVRRRLRCDHPVLAELSGGLDSSSIVCMADDILLQEGAEIPRLDTFSYFNANEPADDDRAFFEAVEKKRGRAGIHVCRGDQLTLSFDHSLFAASPGYVERQELRSVHREWASQGSYRVVLSGTGGDEMLGNALDARVLMADLLRQGRAREFGHQLIRWSLRTRHPLLQLFAQTLALLLPGAVRSRLGAACRLEPWLNSKFAKKHRLALRELNAADGSWLWLPSVRDTCQTIRDLGRQMSQTGPSLQEKRYPYLDQTLVEFLASVPPTQILRLGERRSLLRRALANMLPAEVLARRGKASAGRCFIVTLQSHWSRLEPVLCSPLVSRLGYVEQAAFRRALLDLKNGQLTPYFLRLIKAVYCELWLRDVVERGVVVLGSADVALSVESRIRKSTLDAGQFLM